MLQNNLGYKQQAYSPSYPKMQNPFVHQQPHGNNAEVLQNINQQLMQQKYMPYYPNNSGHPMYPSQQPLSAGRNNIMLKLKIFHSTQKHH